MCADAANVHAECTMQENLSVAGLRIAAAAVSNFPELSCFYKKLCMEMQSAVCGESTVLRLKASDAGYLCALYDSDGRSCS